MGDLIDRPAVIDALNSVIRHVELVEDRLEWLPSLQLERKKGKWNGYNADNPRWLRDDGSPIFLVCSECSESVINNGSTHWNYCPNCGADMRGEQDEQE